jgi:hypothetical protein
MMKEFHARQLIGNSTILNKTNPKENHPWSQKPKNTTKNEKHTTAASRAHFLFLGRLALAIVRKS